MYTLYHSTAVPSDEHPYDFVVVDSDTATILLAAGWVDSPTKL